MIRLATHFFRSYKTKFNFEPKKMEKISDFLYQSPENQKWRNRCVVINEGLFNFEMEAIENIKKFCKSKNLNFYLLKFRGDRSGISEEIKAEIFFDFSIQNFDFSNLENPEVKLIAVEPVVFQDLNYLNHVMRKIAVIKYKESLINLVEKRKNSDQEIEEIFDEFFELEKNNLFKGDFGAEVPPGDAKGLSVISYRQDDPIYNFKFYPKIEGDVDGVELKKSVFYKSTVRDELTTEIKRILLD